MAWNDICKHLFFLKKNDKGEILIKSILSSNT